MTSILHSENERLKGRNLVRIVSLIQIGLALGLLFLPIFGTCIENQPCQYQSYIQMGGTPLGYGFLGTMIVIGGLIIVTSRMRNSPCIRTLMWLDIGACVLLAILGAWSFGLAFVPIAGMMLLALRSTRSVG